MLAIRWYAIRFAGGWQGSPMQNRDAVPLTHQHGGGMPNFGGIGPGSGRVKAQGALRGKLPAPPGSGGGF